VEVRVNDLPVRSELRRGGTETAAAQLHQGVPDVCVLPTVVSPDTRSIRGNPVPPKDMIAPQRRKIRSSSDGERHLAKGTWVEVDSGEPALTEFQQLELEDAAPADQPEQLLDLLGEPPRRRDCCGQRGATAL
jgi:hypothetical protein